MRRLAPLLVLLALLVAPYERMQAQPAVDHTPAMAMTGHCDPTPPANPAPAHHGSIDCMIACAGVPVGEAGMAAPPLPLVDEMVASAVAALHGILPQFDPPPPRLHS